MSDWYKSIELWEENDVLSFLSSYNDETGELELKSSKTSIDELANKLAIAASAFWNAGISNGIFIVGIDPLSKQIDGGIEEYKGREYICDWIDTKLKEKVEPLGIYTRKAISATSSASLIKQGKVILVVAFGQSPNPPHMAYDGKYYIRAGAHSGAAKHFLVEAIRLRAKYTTPLIRGLIRFSEYRPNIVELVVMTLNEAAALDVSIDLKPLPKYLENLDERNKNKLPIKVPFIDRNHPFNMDIAVWLGVSETFGTNIVDLNVSYFDLTGRKFEYSQSIDPNLNLPPIKMSSSEETRSILKAIKDEISQVRKMFYSYFTEVLKKDDE